MDKYTANIMYQYRAYWHVTPNHIACKHGNLKLSHNAHRGEMPFLKSALHSLRG